MKILILLIYFIIIFSDARGDNQHKCSDLYANDELSSGWYMSEPYQFINIEFGNNRLIGFDIDLVKYIAQEVGLKIRYKEISWWQHQLDLQSGCVDIAAGATYTDERAKFVYFSKAYRFEENSLFILGNVEKNLHFHNISELLAKLRFQNFRLGVEKNFIYASPQINEFINNAANQDIIFRFDINEQLLEALLQKKIDGFLADRLVGTSEISKQLLSDKVKEVRLNIKTPIHLIFSKQTISKELVARFDDIIQKLHEAKEYKNIVRTYFYPNLLFNIVSSGWFDIIAIIGTLAFAISGVIISAQENNTLFSSALLALLPSISGNIIYNIIISRGGSSINLDLSCIYYALLIVLIGFMSVRFLCYIRADIEKDYFINNLFNNIVVICDAIGQAAFVMIGVAIAFMVRATPIEFFGILFAFLISEMGKILRESLRIDRKVTIYVMTESGIIISILWGFIFSLLLNNMIDDSNINVIKHLIMFVSFGIFCHKMLIYYKIIPDLKFYNNNK